MTNDVPTNLVDVTVTMQNYYYKLPVPKSKSKNILVEKKCNKPTEAHPIKRALGNIVKRKKERSEKHKHHVWDTVPQSPPLKLPDLDSSSGFIMVFLLKTH
jgi:hypothetical protein